MIDGPAVLIGTVAGGVWLLDVLLAARTIIRENRWPFFIPTACAEARLHGSDRGALWAGAFIVMLFIAAFTLVPLSLGAIFLLLTQAVLNALTS